MNTETDKKPEVSAPQLAVLGTGSLGYIREIDSDYAGKLLGPRINVPDGIRLYCLYGADGTPVSISGSWEAAVANALEHELTPVSIH
ncbi:MAG: DUF1150 family protein [Hyphomicrobiales bacterium]|jgi:hypothetical protein